LLVDRNLPLKLKTVPTSINKHEVYEMKRMAEEDFHAEFKFDPLVNPRIDCSQSPLAVRLSPEEVVALDYFDPSRQGEYKRLLDDERQARAAQSENPDANHRYFCGGGMSGCAVDPTGRMSICVISHQQGYDIRGGSFREGWNGRLSEIRNQDRTKESICDRCQIRSVCGMCPANGELENGDPESPVDFLCQVAHLRTYALGMDVPEHGDCPCCKPGKLHSDLVVAARRIENERPNPSLWGPSNVAAPILNVLQPAHRSGACGSCAAHRA
jgi:radical SAM protein with 4Fe4S-binding SPASM domain